MSAPTKHGLLEFIRDEKKREQIVHLTRNITMKDFSRLAHDLDAKIVETPGFNIISYVKRKIRKLGKKKVKLSRVKTETSGSPLATISPTEKKKRKRKRKRVKSIDDEDPPSPKRRKLALPPLPQHVPNVNPIPPSPIPFEKKVALPPPHMNLLAPEKLDPDPNVIINYSGSAEPTLLRILKGSSSSPLAAAPQTPLRDIYEDDPEVSPPAVAKSTISTTNLLATPLKQIERGESVDDVSEPVQKELFLVERVIIQEEEEEEEVYLPKERGLKCERDEEDESFVCEEEDEQRIGRNYLFSRRGRGQGLINPWC